MYNLGHSSQGGMLFVMLAAFAVPSLGTNPRAGAWLRSTLLYAVLAPIYLNAGISKVRYMGPGEHLKGEWIRKAIASERRSLIPAMNRLIEHSSTLPALLSWGNMFIEIALPLLVLLVAQRRYPLLHSLVRKHARARW